MSELLVQAILIGLAGFRVASLLVDEDGPYNIFTDLRTKLGVVPPVRPGEIQKRSNGIATIFTCTWCMSIWTTLAMWGLWELEPLAVAVIAAMSVALLVDRWVQ